MRIVVPPVREARHKDVDNLAVLVDCPVPVPPPTRDLHVGLVNAPTIANRVPARPGRIGEPRREALHPPVHRDVIDLDTTLRQQFLNVAIRQAEPQRPTRRENDHLKWKPKPGER
jgi:hypothetical protein